jgi:alpha-mannosidase
MMQEKQFKLYYDRMKKFYANLENDFWQETKVVNAKICPDKQIVAYEDRKNGDFVQAHEGMVWGDLWDSAWLHIEETIPAEWQDKSLGLRLNLGGEVLLFDEKGVPQYGLTNTSVFMSCYRKEIYQLDEKTNSSGKLDMWLELAANGLFGDEINPDVPGQKCDVGLIRHLRLGVFNKEVWHLRLDIEVLFGLLNVERPAGDFVFGSPSFPKESRRAVKLMMLINNAIDVYAQNPANAAAARKILAPEMNRPALSSAPQVTAVGHAHIDTGWLWPVRETVRKCARTFASQLSLMKQYPDYVFGESQPQLYAFVKEYYPELFAQIKERVAEGRWELQGGMWVEADCNLINGESMVRQFMHGKNFFMDEFNVDVKNLWLPDVFGYSAAMPQIIRKSGCDYFLTQKICWNQFNRFPYHAFTWHGIDKSEVLTFFPPEDTYNSLLVPDQINYGVDNLTENYILDESLTLFGIGNGGGGPKEEHIERGLRCHDLECCPKVKFGRADHFFERLAERQAELPHYHGELYLEIHRGTLTTQAKNKLYNRQLEQALVEMEFLATLLPIEQYPQEELDKSWKTLLLNQFHDILPGASIRKVYDVTDKEYAEIFARLEDLRQKLANSIFEKDAKSLTIANTLSSDYTRLIELPEDWSNHEVYCNGERLPKQNNLAEVIIPAQGILTLTKGEKCSAEIQDTIDGLILENKLIRYEFDSNGQLTSAFDKETRREVIVGTGNVFSLYGDVSNSYDAWDVDLFYEREQLADAALVNFRWLESGKLCQKLEFNFAVSNSTIKQTITLEENSKRLEFKNEVDWHEDKKMLRVAFSTSVVSDEAACDIQYGFVKRSTRRNTNLDLAKFEMVAQRYIDISEAHYGVALLNNCKYGHKVLDGTIDLNLLRSPSWPDPDADRGKHEFTFALLPHCGNLLESKVMIEAAMLNRPARLFTGFATQAAMPCRVIKSNGANLEVLKKAEKSNEYVIRLVDTTGIGSTALLEFPYPVSLQESNLIEWQDLPEIELTECQFKLELKAFEIKTIKFRQVAGPKN